MKNAGLILIAAISLFPVFAQDLYDIDHITEIKIYFDDANWDATMDSYYANDQDELLYGTCEINGVNYDSVGVAYKGNSTYNENNLKNPLKIKLAEVFDFQQYHNCQTLKLSNGFKDPSFVREVLSYEIGRKYMDMPLSNYATVYINDQYYGLFVSSESINGDFMEKRFYCDDDNVRVKCNPDYGSGSSSMEYLGSDTTLYYSSYEMKSDFGWTELADLCNQLQNNLANIEQVLDVDAAIWMLAFDNVLVNLDSYIGPLKQNYYLIQDDNGIFHPVIWDLNQSIASFTMLGGPPGPPNMSDFTDLELFHKETDQTYPLIYYLFSNPRYRKMYVAHCKTIVYENFANDDYYTRGQQLQSIIDAEVQNEPNGFYTHAQFIDNLDITTGGGGPENVFGIKEIMDPRVDYFTNHAAFSLTAPTVTNIIPTPAVPQANDWVTFTADIQNANYAYLGYRSYKGDPFTKVQMYDDGLHGDGASGDGIWGVELQLGSSDLQYYIWAENNDAGIFSPQRAEHEFYELNLSGGVVINELMASNNITAADEYGEYNDWIEFYNNSSSAVDLSGYFLSDDPLNVTKWSFPVGTTIDAGDYLIVWADNDGQSGLHANFKLSSGGETLVFSDPLGNPINTVQYPKVEDNGTYGRFPNGTGGFIPMYATFNAENSFTAVEVEEDENVALNVFPNPASDVVYIKGISADGEKIRIYNLQGQVVLEKFIQDNEAIDVSGLTSGAYLLQFIGSQQIKKMVVR